MSDCSTNALKAKKSREDGGRMTKTRSQLRAEAVERLRKLNCMDVDCYQLLEAVVDDAGEKVGYRVEIKKLIDLLTDDAQEARGSYEERLHDVPVSDCPYCGCERVVIHDFSDIYENPHSYRVEHVDEKEAFEAGCFETYCAFDSVEKAVGHANMRDLLTDEPMDARRDSDGTCPDADRTASNAPSSTVCPSENLDAQARAEIEDAERSRAVSGDSGQDADVDSTENAKAAQDSREKAIAAWNTRAEHERFLEEKFCELIQRLQFPLNEQREMLNSLRCGAVEAETSQVIEHTSQVTEHDTRAKLESDICAKLNDMARFSWRVDGIMKQAKGWLDRQAAITRAECDKPNWDYCETCEQFKAMQDKIDELEAALKGERNNFYQATESCKHWQREYESAKAERDELKSKADALEADKASWQSAYHIDRLAKLQAQRDRYRDLLAKAVDEAQAIEKLMEVES